MPSLIRRRFVGLDIFRVLKKLEAAEPSTRNGDVLHIALTGRLKI